MIGVDVAVAELRELVPFKELGSSTLAFIVDRNGDVIFSESLSGEAEDYLERVKGLSEVDFFDLWPLREEDNNKTKVTISVTSVQ